ncbi:LytTR family DNA-binding domain-containing protein [Wenzhouxiangella sp. 15190]|uniref:LytTR family DNA-binding domain-containing protein n=1 Tax=unclassified Wenzhouxiangella TaxID=2613841 RepID=UPI003857A714
MSEQLPPEHFERVHRSYIVNLDQVSSIEPLDTGDARIHMRQGQIIPCSRSYRDSLMNRLSRGESLRDGGCPYNSSPWLKSALDSLHTVRCAEKTPLKDRRHPNQPPNGPKNQDTHGL